MPAGPKSIHESKSLPGKESTTFAQRRFITRVKDFAGVLFKRTEVDRALIFPPRFFILFL
jgi:hypothetical protein